MILANHLRNTNPWFNDIGRLIDAAFDRFDTSPSPFRVHDSDEAWTLEIDLPGVPKDAVEVEIKDDALHLSVKREDEDAVSYRLPLDKRIDTSGIDARLDLGVLSVRLPKASHVNETKRIEIK